MSEFILAMPFVSHSTNNNQSTEWKKKTEMWFITTVSKIFSHNLPAVPYTDPWAPSNSSCRHWSCSLVAFRGAQSDSPRLVTDPSILFHDNTRCGFLSLVRTSTLQKQLQKVAISAFTKHIRLLNANLAFQKEFLQGERAKEQIQVFFAGALGFTSIMACLLISELLCLPLCLISGVPEWLGDQWSSWGTSWQGKGAKDCEG